MHPIILFPLAGAIGAVVGRSRGGRFSNLLSPSLRAPALVWSALAIQVWLATTASRSSPLPRRFALLLTSYVAVGGWLAANTVANRALRSALALLTVGWVLNLAAIVANGAMPVSAPAMAASGIPSETAVDEGHLGKHVAASTSTVLPWLGDVIPARPLRSVISMGDVVMCVGIAVATFRSMRSESMRAQGGARRRATPE